MSVPDGCTNGTTHEWAVRNAISRFSDNRLYGGDDNTIVFASTMEGSTLAQIAYSCSNGASPPLLDGRSIRTQSVFHPSQSRLQSRLTFTGRLEKLTSCPNLCGSVQHPNENDCGFGLLIAQGADLECWDLAANINPRGQFPTIRPSVGNFEHIGCWSDDPTARTLSGGSLLAQDMTIDKCVSLGSEFQYVGLQNGM